MSLVFESCRFSPSTFDQSLTSLGSNSSAVTIHGPTKAICVGLNYAKHAKESGAEPPKEPVIFMKAPNTMIDSKNHVTSS